MKYTGKLYGKIGGKTFDTGHTSEDWDNLVDALESFVLYYVDMKYIVTENVFNIIEKGEQALEKATK